MPRSASVFTTVELPQAKPRRWLVKENSSTANGLSHSLSFPASVP